MTQLLIYIIPIIIIAVLLIWWRKSCKWNEYGLFTDDKKVNFPTIGHNIILIALSFIPIFGLIEAIVIVAIYVALRVTGEIELKPTKFNKKFFNIDENDV
jgi:hypothetical protein